MTAAAFRFVLPLSLVLLAGCGEQAARPKIASITGAQSGTETFEYTSDRLTSQRVVDADGALRSEATLEYEDDRVASIHASNPQAGRSVELRFSYLDDRLTSYTRNTTVDGVTEAMTVTYEYTDDDRLRRTTVTSPGFSASNEFVYDADRLIRIEQGTVNGDPIVREFRYDSAGLLTEYARSNAGTWTLEYDGDARLLQMGTEGESHAFEYSAERISVVTRTVQGKAERIAYAYSDGTVIGPLPVPRAGEPGVYFDLEGQRRPAGREFFTTRFLIGF